LASFDSQYSFAKQSQSSHLFISFFCLRRWTKLRKIFCSFCFYFLI
jgi:hypothetical protein